MRAVDMKYKFDIKLRGLLGALNHPFTTNEINRFINESQLAIVREYADDFEKDENVRQTLSVLTQRYITTTFTTDQTTLPYSYYVTLPSDILSIVSELVNDHIRVKPITHDEYSVNVHNPFKEPSSTLVWRLDIDDKRELITDGSLTLAKYTVDYVTLPPDIDIDAGVDCVLTPQIHEDIVNRAVALAFEVISKTAQVINPKQTKE